MVGDLISQREVFKDVAYDQEYVYIKVFMWLDVMTADKGNVFDYWN